MPKVKWIIDPVHSEIEFKVKYLMITNVIGRFDRFDMTVETEEEDFNTGKVWFSADVDSLETNDHERNGHLKSPDFFDIAAYPHIIFESGDMKVDGEVGEISGNLTIKNTTKPVTFKVDFGGVTMDMYGTTRAGFSISTEIDRKEFGLRWNSILEGGGMMVGDKVRISGEIQLVKR
ncbi:MAG TPA: YceI family protein [Saprospiraceae bacterium]|nr:YceI family protein [Candidatus Parvibacillus calidus]MBX2938101.1 YceI family protein [Saprospiraceae bacterium]MBX7180441.1 YceI family protein [Saprospiraceae bacterium]MCB0590856.1 YceI family protein [Saprospiraceae bacterium]MCO5283892.1 YceI family protein [Saprospiraceae bacterium]